MVEVTPGTVEAILVMRELLQHQQDREVRRRRPPLTQATRGATTVLQLRAVAAVDSTPEATTSPVLHMVVVAIHLPLAAVAGAAAPTAAAPMATRVATGDKRPSLPNLWPRAVRTDDRQSSTGTRYEGWALALAMELQVIMMVWSRALQCCWVRWMSGCMALSVAPPLHWRRFGSVIVLATLFTEYCG